MIHITLLIGLFLGGCVHSTQIDSQPTFHLNETFSLSGQTALTNPWYQQFDDQVLNELIAIAFDQNYSLKAAVERLNAAQLQYGVSRSQRWPEVSANAGASVRDTKTTVSSSATGGWRETSSADIQLSWVLDFWGRLQSAAKRDQALAYASAADHQSAKLLLASEVTKSYFRLLAHHKAIKQLLSQFSANQKQVELLKLKQSVGLANFLAVQQQEQSALEIEAKLINRQNNYDTEVNQLAILLGESPINFAPPAMDELPSLPMLPKLITPAQLISKHPKLTASYQKLVAADQDVAIAFANRLPNITITSQYEISGTELGGQLPNTLWKLAADLTQPLFDAGQRKKGYKLKQAVLRERMAEFNQLYLDTIYEVETALTNEKHQQELGETTIEQLKLAERNVTESNYQYSIGQIDYLNVITSMNQFDALSTTATDRQLSLLLNRIDIYLALGALEQGASEHG